MAFASEIREELIRCPLGKTCCMLAELCALTQTIGSLRLRGGGQTCLVWQTETAALARRVFQLLRTRFEAAPKLHVISHGSESGRRACVITLEGREAERLMIALGMMETAENGELTLRRMTPKLNVTRQCCTRAYLRGAFLGAGTMTSPEKSYHLEWKADDASLRQALGRALEKNGLPAQSYERAGTQVMYLKRAQQIADVLALMGASSAVLKLENVRIRREMRGDANRAANCDTHNADRTAEASARQLEAIRALALTRGLKSLPPRLEQLARLRLDDPEMSIAELGQLLSPPIGKSGISHRMARLMALAEPLLQDPKHSNPLS